LGVWYNHLGLSKPSAYNVTVKPGGAMGFSAAPQPITLQKFMEDLVIYGGGSVSFFCDKTGIFIMQKIKESNKKVFIKNIYYLNTSLNNKQKLCPYKREIKTSSIYQPEDFTGLPYLVLNK
jgi:hypothetical protein